MDELQLERLRSPEVRAMGRSQGVVPVVWLLLLLPTMVPTRLSASTWKLISVAQPLLGEGLMEIRDVPFSTDSFVPGAEVALTCAANAIRNIGEDFDEEVEDRNAASKYALTLTLGPVWNGKAVFDTLAVTLDATHLDSAAVAKGLGAGPDSIVEATALCIRINAARSGFATKYLKLNVLGPARFKRFGGVYAVEHLALPTRTYDFGPPVSPQPVRRK